jgi:hypothetical protein
MYSNEPITLATALRDAVLEARIKPAARRAWSAYLRNLAVLNSSAFGRLLGKVLPSTIQGPGDKGEHKIHAVAWTGDPKVD